MLSTVNYQPILNGTFGSIITKFPCNTLPACCWEEVFQYLDLSDIYRCMLVCKRWYSIIFAKDRYLWKKLCLKILPRAALEDTELLEIFPDKIALLRAFIYSWNPEDISETMNVKPDGFTVYRRPTPLCTDAVRGKTPVSKGVHAFDFVWRSPFGTSATIGFATAFERLHCNGYDKLLGRSSHSWVWNLVGCSTHHNNDIRLFPTSYNARTRIKTNPPSKIRLIIDCERNMAGYERDDEFLGIAFKDLPQAEFFPIVSAVYGHTEVSMYYMDADYFI